MLLDTFSAALVGLQAIQPFLTSRRYDVDEQYQVQLRMPDRDHPNSDAGTLDYVLGILWDVVDAETNEILKTFHDQRDVDTYAHMLNYR
ncbi:hypothetical protein C1H69_10090 [Billgrantia endophytica]|uniref:Uncharacterized protein n=1 Tax=Billgrantia endophytica TaxID=2033802 RepID=A0A2N7U4C3_9GAMM|nr:hypothetical protein C1H69_10090 [Halomonas endophytica]